MATLLFISDGDAEHVLPALQSAGHDVKTEPLATSPERIASLAPDVVLVDATQHPAAAFACLHSLRASGARIPSLAVVGGEGLELHPWHEIAHEFIAPEATSAELRMRLAMVRRREGTGDGSEIRLGPLALDVLTYRASIDGHPLDLAFKEFELLRYLASRPGRVFTREVLLRDVWGFGFYGGTRTVDVHVRRLRAKLGPANETIIETVRGVGYRATDRW